MILFPSKLQNQSIFQAPTFVCIIFIYREGFEDSMALYVGEDLVIGVGDEIKKLQVKKINLGKLV